MRGIALAILTAGISIALAIEFTVTKGLDKKTATLLGLLSIAPWSYRF
jgi:hypothetical protein